MENFAEVESWLSKSLAEVLDLNIEETIDIARYISSMENYEEMQGYITELVNICNPQLPGLLSKLQQCCTKKQAESLMYRKPNAAKGEKTKSAKGKSKGKGTGHAIGLLEAPKAKTPLDVVRQTNTEKTSSTSLNDQEIDKRKKQKFVPLMSSDGQARASVKLPGRHPCDCQAVKHALVNNCLGCGRIVCQQEGSGPCLFCGELVCTETEREVLNRGSKKSAALRDKLMSVGGGGSHLAAGMGGAGMQGPGERIAEAKGLRKAEEHKLKLLEYDQTSARRTQVIDDEADYFSTGSQWLSKTERSKLRRREEELREQRHGSRRGARKVTLDFAGRQVLDASEEASKDMYSKEDEIVQEVFYAGKKEAVPRSYIKEGIVNPNILGDAPMYTCLPLADNVPKVAKLTSCSQGNDCRLQDSTLQQMSDRGMCMSMHQPWASLLVAGIKRHEGRSWYSEHRGRLWIAATAKEAQAEEVAHMEQFYRQHYADHEIQFPSEYPAGCLLGCVDVVDVLPQDEYRQQFPEGESESPNVFVCADPQSLLVKFPIKGKHKIYKLDKHIHDAAKKGISPSPEAVL